jgi:hypothetical protein
MAPTTQLMRAQLWTLVFLVFASGCGGGNSGGHKGPKGTVSGRMMIGGAPLKEGCLVMFQSVEGGYVATGTIKSEGKYTLTCDGSFDIPAVAYRVQLSPPSTVEPLKSSQPQDPSMMAAKVMGPTGTATVKEAAKPPFPAMYLSAITSKLEYTVKAGANTADFDLTP